MERPALSLVGAPSSAGAYAPGQETAPTALRRAGLPSVLEHAGWSVRDRGDTALRRWSPDPRSPRAQNVEAVERTIEEVAALAVPPLEAGETTLVLGGDCTVGIGTLRALDGVDGEAGLVYLDLHADMNTPSSVIDGALDWMGLGHLLGVDGTWGGAAGAPLLAPERVVLLGLGSSTRWEDEQIARLGVPVVPVGDVAEDPAAAARRALALLPVSCGRIAVHFDVDVVDFVDAPLSENTGRNVGVPLATALTALATLAADPRVGAVTLTELNPLHGEADGSTLGRLVEGLAGALPPLRR